MAVSNVELRVGATQAIKVLQQVNQKTQQLGGNTDKLKRRLDGSSKAFRETGRSAQVATKGVGGLTSALGPLLRALAVAATARFVFVKTAELETQRTALTQLTGSAEDANKIINIQEQHKQ